MFERQSTDSPLCTSLSSYNRTHNSEQAATMPHKRSKRSARDADRAAQGTDNAPTSKNEGVLAGQNAKFGGLSAKMYRILNAETIRKEKKDRDALKRKRDDGDDDGKASSSSKSNAAGASDASKKLKIMPGEKMKTFNACVSADFTAQKATWLVVTYANV